MQRSPFSLFAAAALAALLAIGPLAAETPAPGAVDFGALPASRDGKCVEVDINTDLLAFTATLAKTQEPALAKLLSGLKAIRVRVVGLDDQNRAAVTERIGKIRSQLVAQGWDRTVTARDRGDDVALFVKSGPGNAIEGLVVTVLGGKGEAVLVNVVGAIDPEQLATLAAKFHLPSVPSFPKSPATPAPTTSAEADAS